MHLDIYPKDTICVKRKKIVAVVSGKKYVFKLSEIEEIILIVKRNENNQNEFSLGIRIDEKTSILLLSLHALYNKFLYTDLKAVLPIDYNSVAMAELSEEKKIYSIYKRDVE